MIKRFGCLYSGHAEMQEFGFDTTPVNDRFLTDEELAAPLHTATELAELLERLGFETLWMAEHHFQPEGYECLPNLPMMAVHIAGRTQRIKIGCAFSIAPMWHPLRLAEDYAVADHLTDGRLIFGVGRGYHTREVESLGGPMLDQAVNREYFEEQMEIIFKAFNSRSFSHHGKYFDIPPKVPYRGYELEEIALVPRPKNLPVECYQPIVSASARGLRFMAKHGIKGVMGGGAGPGGANYEVVRAFQEVQAEFGRDTELGENLVVGLDIHLGKTREQALKEVQPYFEENIKVFGPLGFTPRLTPEQLSSLNDPSESDFAAIPSTEEFVDNGHYQFGTPQYLIDEIGKLQDTYPGLETVTVQPVIPLPKSQMFEQMQWFAEEVLPGFVNT
jgi:alkanesulfonate monooxygenase SsuD/methylene tetrahydromethanopterin reductase-like flavin-dependent oxidoreductase (luciferase family)